MKLLLKTWWTVGLLIKSSSWSCKVEKPDMYLDKFRKQMNGQNIPQHLYVKLGLLLLVLFLCVRVKTQRSTEVKSLGQGQRQQERWGGKPGHSPPTYTFLSGTLPSLSRQNFYFSYFPLWNLNLGFDSSHFLSVLWKKIIKIHIHCQMNHGTVSIK